MERTPKPELNSITFHHDFVHIPNIAGLRLSAPQVARDLRSKLRDPAPDRLVGDVHSKLEQHFFNFA